MPLNKARAQFYSGNLSGAEQALGECSAVPKRDRLLCYMEKGSILYYMKEYEQSTEVLLRASKFIRDEDLVSIKDQATSVMVNDKTATYKGEYSERLWVHTFLMMNFLMQYKYESALVEAKQALEEYGRHPEALEDDHFTRALIALCYENMNQPDDARIEYEKIAESTGEERISPAPIPEGKGELILFVSRGRIPEKISADVVVPPSIRISVPRYASSSAFSPVNVYADGRESDHSDFSVNLGDAAAKSLNKRAAQYLTRQALRAGSKEAIAREVGEESVIGEALARIFLFLLEEADTRSWETLPGDLTLVRIVLDAGVHDINVSSGYSNSVNLSGVDIPEGRRIYREVRF